MRIPIRLSSCVLDFMFPGSLPIFLRKLVAPRKKAGQAWSKTRMLDLIASPGTVIFICIHLFAKSGTKSEFGK